MELAEPTPDHAVTIGDGVEVLVEIKELGEDENFSMEPLVVSSRTVGDHIRRKITAARKRIKFGAEQGIPSILLVYNNIDPLHLFGTEDTDFIRSISGELTLRLDKKGGRKVGACNGRNQSLAEAQNTSFIAVGRLWPVRGKMSLMLFDNVYSKVRVPYEKLPHCFGVTRIEVTPCTPPLGQCPQIRPS